MKEKCSFLSFFIAVILTLSLVMVNVQAGTYFSIKPDNEVCTRTAFGYHGRGEYTLTSEDHGYPDNPWIDNHFTSLVAGSENIVIVPLCFSAMGRKLEDQAIVRVIINTPSGNVTEDYGVCVDEYEDVDVVAGTITGNACERMAEHTDIFSAALAPPEKYAGPGETVIYTLLLDSSMPLTLEIAKGAGGADMNIVASQTSVEATASQQQVLLRVTAPNTPGDYRFDVMVTAAGCIIADCRRTVTGMLHVAEADDRPQSGFDVWLSPKSKSIVGQQRTDYTITFKNYGEGKRFTATVVTTPLGLDSNFAHQSEFVVKGVEKSLVFNVRPVEPKAGSYKITAVVTREDGIKRSAEAWLTVDELVADASKLGRDDVADEIRRRGGTTQQEWQELKSTGGAVVGRTDLPPDLRPEPGPNYILWVAIAAVIAIIAILVIIIYKKTMVAGEGMSWKDLGV